MNHLSCPTPKTVFLRGLLILALAARASFAAETGAATNAPAAAPSPTEPAPVVAVKDYLKDPKAYAGKRIVLQGFVTEVCRKKGCWALLHDTDSEAKGQVRVKQDEDGSTFKPFLPELQGRTILVTSDVKETRVDGAYLDNWEKTVKAAKEKAAKEAATGAAKGGAEEADEYDAILKRIAEYRERLAKSERGYLSSYSLAALEWRAADGNK